MSDPTHDNGSEGQHGGSRFIPGVDPQISVAGGALATGRGKRRSHRREDGDEEAKKYSPEE